MKPSCLLSEPLHESSSRFTDAVRCVWESELGSREVRREVIQVLLPALKELTCLHMFSSQLGEKLISKPGVPTT